MPLVPHFDEDDIMATDNFTARVPFGAISAHRIGDFFWRFNARMAERRALRETLDALARLDARQLDDIGLTAADIESMESRARIF